MPDGRKCPYCNAYLYPDPTGGVECLHCDGLVVEAQRDTYRRLAIEALTGEYQGEGWPEDGACDEWKVRLCAAMGLQLGWSEILDLEADEIESRAKRVTPSTDTT